MPSFQPCGCQVVPPAINMASPFLTVGVKPVVSAYPFIFIHLAFYRRMA
jgi:hypothetical protein